MTMMTVEHEWLKTGEAASLADVTQHTIRAWILKAPLMGKRVGGRWRVRRDFIENIAAGKARVEDYAEQDDG